MEQTHGWLCRDKGSEFLWFHFMEPRVDEYGLWWSPSNKNTGVPIGLPAEFEQEYDYNFKLPGEGEKVECWVEM